MTIELSARQERVIQDAIRQGRFQSVEQAVDAALTTLISGAPPAHRFTPGEAVTRIRSLRQGNILPADTTIRAMIEDGRA